jgi:wyosine [tRNA(Phe)-imidazoG37] synthetase (radical SAM superfamily)
MVINLQQGIVYGPVNSRRLGRSLGINVLSTGIKVCSFNCLYCQYGFTRVASLDLNDPKHFATLNEVHSAIASTLTMVSPPPAYITLSGNGEATLHPEFDKIVMAIIELRDRYCPEAKTAILSNSSTVANQKIRNALEMLDVRIMKLDSADEKMYKNYNQPCCNIQLHDIIEGLKSLNRVTIQTLFSEGERGNCHPDHLESWVERIKYIEPIHVQIYTVDRSYPSQDIYPTNKEFMIKIKERLAVEGISSEVY